MGARLVREWKDGAVAREGEVGCGQMGLAPQASVRVSESSWRAMGALSGCKEEREMTIFAF